MLRELFLSVAVAAAPAALAQNTTAAREDAGADAELVLPPTFQEIRVPVMLDSGLVEAPAKVEANQHLAVIFSQEITAPGAPWVRVNFDEVMLSGDPRTADATILVITSLHDNAVQYLDARTAREWQNTSAYFNGDTVRIELMAAPGTGASRVAVKELWAGVAPDPTRSLCGGVDDRALSDDPRMGRMMPIGCTAWLFNDRQNCLLTAGHCGPSNTQVMQFNVPLSTAGGTPVAPPPEDQYIVDPASIQSNGGGGVGNDWSTFGVFDNANTGLSPLQAQGDSVQLANAAPPVTGQSIRVTGFGSTTSPVPASWYLVQKTHAGPFVYNSGTTIRYAMDTTGGNSGSAVIDETTGLAIGIHTHAGCDSVGGNQGTNINHADLQNALANPQGICSPPGLSFSYPGGLPVSVQPDGSTTLSVAVTPDEGVTLDPASVVLNVVDGKSIVQVPMIETSPGQFEASFPPSDCGDNVLYYITALDAAATAYADPRTAPADTHSALSATAVIVAADDDFETDTGWTVVNDPALSTGAWVRAVPGNFGRADPPADADGSGRCFVTGNTLNQDIDGGPTTLISPAYDLSAANDPKISFQSWYATNLSDTDRLNVEISDDGATWTQIASWANQGEQWIAREYRVLDYVSLTNTVSVRFVTFDVPNDSVSEAAIDAFRILDAECEESCNPADLAEPFGELNFTDVTAFIVAFSNSDPVADFEAPFGVFDFIDVLSFLDSFSNGCP